ncbi:MAG: GNAT family N-acetyltransferase [Anaerolineae bacterium]|nr:GNAT family N-acetyltransferase [Anaerolineae bacterium]
MSRFKDIKDIIVIQTLEEYGFRAWAALETEIYDGWVLRFANGYTGRSNSINPLYTSTLDLDTKLAYCADWYATRGITHRYRLNDAMQPPELEAVLERKGYVLDNESLVMTMNLADVGVIVSDGEVNIQGHYTDEWLTNFCLLHPAHAPHRATIQAIMDRMPTTKYFASIVANGEVIAMGLGIQEDDYVGLYDIITRQDQRGKGYSKHLVSSILHCAALTGVKKAYLQVMEDNAPARRVYEKAGFRLVYRYWYRVPPTQS